MPKATGRVDAKRVTASHHELGKRGTFDVNVEFSATIRVTNPGAIQRYMVTLTGP